MRGRKKRFERNCVQLETRTERAMVRPRMIVGKSSLWRSQETGPKPMEYPAVMREQARMKIVMMEMACRDEEEEDKSPDFPCMPMAKEMERMSIPRPIRAIPERRRGLLPKVSI
jgi:hypothetical protein